MSEGTPTWDDLADAIAPVGVTPGAPLTNAQQAEVWRNLAAVVDAAPLLPGESAEERAAGTAELRRNADFVERLDVPFREAMHLPAP